MDRRKGIRTGRKNSGFSLLELTIALAIALIFFGGVIAAMLSETRAVDNSVRVLLAKSEADRAVMQILEDLQTTNTVERDESGNPYVRVLGMPDGPGDKLWFRRVEGFSVQTGADSVTAIYGSPITYTINADNQFIRVQNGVSKVVANGISSLGFVVNADGTISIRLTAYSGSGQRRVEVTNSLSVTPRNGYDR